MGNSDGDHEQAKHDFFISFTAVDRPWAEWITWVLREAGYSVVIQDDWRPGGNWVGEMHRALDKSRRVIAVLSAHYLMGKYPEAEWAAAFARDPTGEKGTLLPVRVEECKPPGLLGQIIYVDLVGLNDEYSARVMLLQKIRDPSAQPGPLQVGTRAGRPPYPPRARAQLLRVPHKWGQLFEGREDLLAELDAGRGQSRVQAVCGMGGVGKTRLVVEYAYRHRADYELICWVKAGGAGTLVSEYAALAEPLNVPNPGSLDQTLVLDEVRQKLSAARNFLLVLDGVPGPYVKVREARAFEKVLDFLPEPGTSHVIVTSRERSWEQITKDVIHVREFSQADAVDFLLKRTASQDEPGAQSLSEVLGYLPLALEQAGAYITEAEISFGDYLVRLARYPKLFTKGQPQDYDETVATTWQVSIDRVRRELPAAAEVFEVLAFLASDDIPRWLFSQPAPGLSARVHEVTNDIIQLDEVVRTLRLHSLLLQVIQQSIDVHRLVQDIVRTRMTKAKQKRRAADALILIDAHFPEDIDSMETWTLCDQLVPHAEAAAAHAHALGVTSAAAPRLLDRIARYLHERASFLKAKSLFDEALAWAERVFGPDHVETARILNNLGRAEYDRGDWRHAKTRLERAIAILTAKADPDDLELANAYSNYGLVLRDHGDFAGAKEHLERALEIRRRVYQDEDHSEVARALSNLGLMLQEMGDPTRARELQERAVRILLAKHGPDDRKPQIASRRLAVVLYDLSDLVGARDRLQAVLAFFERNAYGEDHPEVARSLYHLAQVQWDDGEYDAARESCERALDIFEAAYGCDHPAVARTLTGLGLVLQDQAEPGLEEARDSFQRALRIFREAYGPSHTEVARTLDALGFVSRHLDDVDGAKRYLHEAIDILRAAFPNQVVQEMGIPYTNLGLVLQEDGDLEAAEAHHLKALEIFRGCRLPPDHHHIHLTNSRLSVVYRLTGRYTEATELLEEALRVFKAKYRSNHPDIARIEEKLGLVWADRGDAQRAEHHLRTALEMFTATWGPNQPRRVLSARRLEGFRRNLPS